MNHNFARTSALGAVLLLWPVLFLAFSGCTLLPKSAAPQKSAVSKVRRAPANAEIQKELTDLATEPVLVAAADVNFDAKVDAKVDAKPENPKPATEEASAGIGRKISGAASSAAVAEVKVQEMPDGELLITPAAIAKAAAAKTNKRVELKEPQVAGLTPREPLRKLKSLESSDIELSSSNETPLIFDIPVTYNERVRVWIRFFQNEGRNTFRNWLERSSRFLPVLQYELQHAGLPQDLVYVAMIESGFVSHAASHAGAKGMWQFIAPTATRYKLKIDWWIDERQDFHKSTRAAISYMNDLYGQFNSWYLVAASYNMGEGGVRRLIKRYGTNNFWDLAERGVLPQETTDYVPKIIAAMLISKAPALYGFRDLNYQMPLAFEMVSVPGGTDIVNLAGFLGVSEKYLKDLNPELIKGFIPKSVRGHTIRVPKGSILAVSQFIRTTARND